MIAIPYIIGIAFVIFFIILIAWRLLSQRISLPCPAWLYFCVEMDNPFAKETHAQSIISHLHIKSGIAVVDAGCGSGRVTIPLAQAVGSQGTVTALDVQQGMLDKVKEKAQKNHLENITYVHAGLGAGVLPHNHYDYVLLVTVLGEIPDQHKALQEIFNALKPGGILSITEMIFDPHFQRRTTVEKVTQSVGFVKKELFGSWYAYTMHVQKPITL